MAGSIAETLTLQALIWPLIVFGTDSKIRTEIDKVIIEFTQRHTEIPDAEIISLMR